jgi:hypothetical protein
MSETEITMQLSIPELVTVYEQAVADIQQAYALLRKADDALTEAFSPNDKTHHYANYVIHDNDLYSLKPDKMLKNIRRKIWNHFLDRAGIHKVMSMKRREEIRARMDEIDTEITREIVMDIFASMAAQAPDMLRESAREVFDILRPGSRASNYLKTNARNARFAIGKKVILVGCTLYWQRSWRDRVNAIDRVFHMLDGKGASVQDAYYSELADAIYQQNEGETEYFKFVKYINGNVHLTFKRMDLVQRLNAIAGGEGLTEGAHR